MPVLALPDMGMPAAPEFEHCLSDIEVGLGLSDVAYARQHVAQQLQRNALQDFDNEFKPLFLDRLECKVTGQKYALAVVQYQADGQEARPRLYVAFAGTQKSADWWVSLDALQTADTRVGGRVHRGFLWRAQHVKFCGLERVAAEYGCSHVIFVGHSLGGAVAQLAALLALNGRLFPRVEVLAVGFGAPMSIHPDYAKEIHANRWQSKLLNVVNEGDPVPAVLNVADTLDETVWRRINDFEIPLFDDALQEGIGLSLQGVRAVAQAAVGIAQGAYMPLGVHCFMGVRQEEWRVQLLTGQACKEKLGGADLVAISDGIVKHSLAKYGLAVRLGQFKQMFKSPISLNRISRPCELSQSLEFSLEKAVVEASEDELRMHLIGKNLDFVGAEAVELQRQNAEPIRMSAVVAAGETFLVLQVPFQQGNTASGADVTIKVRPDVRGDDGTIRARISPMNSESRQYVFGEDFFKTMMKNAWIRKRFLGVQDDQNPVLAALGEIDELFPRYETVTILVPTGDGQQPFVTRTERVRRLFKECIEQAGPVTRWETNDLGEAFKGLQGPWWERWLNTIHIAHIVS